MNCSRLFLILMLVALFPGRGSAEEELTAREIQDRFLKCHENIRTWTLEMRVNTEKTHPDRETKKLQTSKRDFKIAYYFDGESMRKDVKMSFLGRRGPEGWMEPVNKGEWPETRYVMTKEHCISFTPTAFAYVEGENVGQPSYTALRVGDFQTFGSSFTRKFFEVQVIGMSALSHGLLGHYSPAKIREQLTKPGISLDEKVERVKVPSGQDAVILRYTSKDGRVFRYWLVPAMDYNAVKIEIVSQFPAEVEGGSPRKMVDSSKFELVYDARNKLWFPRKVFYQRTFGDRVDKQIWKISKAEFNQPISKTVFTLKGLDIREGHPILMPMDDTGRPQLFIWDGEKPVPSPPRN